MEGGFLLVTIDGRGWSFVETWHATMEEAKAEAEFRFLNRGRVGIGESGKLMRFQLGLDLLRWFGPDRSDSLGLPNGPRPLLVGEKIYTEERGGASN